MQISLDISLYPMHKEYITPILQFIKALNTYEGFSIATNPLSTQLHGDFNKIWSALAIELPKCFGTDYTNIVVIKLVSKNVIE